MQGFMVSRVPLKFRVEGLEVEGWGLGFEV